jgi:hypothetical protein
MDFGHTAPQFTLPLGCKARIDGQQATFEIIEAAVQDGEAVVVSLTAVVEELESVADEFPVFLNKRTGEVVSVSTEAMALAEEDHPLDELQDWERDMVETAIDIYETDDYLALPTQFDIHEYGIMKRFSYDYPDKVISDTLLNDISGSGAFQRFKNTIHQYNIQDEWYAYRTKAIEEIAVEWLEDNDLSYSQ